MRTCDVINKSNVPETAISANFQNNANINPDLIWFSKGSYFRYNNSFDEYVRILILLS